MDVNVDIDGDVDIDEFIALEKVMDIFDCLPLGGITIFLFTQPHQPISSPAHLKSPK